LDTRVSILKIHPGITPQVVRNILCGPETRAVIIETYGSGNATSKSWFLDIVKEADKMGKVMVNVTQCLSGSVNMDLYATGKSLESVQEWFPDTTAPRKVRSESYSTYLG
jgi:L-asparaginase